MILTSNAVEETLARAKEKLLSMRAAHGHWEGELSSSALSTATAVVALALVDRERHAGLIHGGLDWLTKNQNADGGWGDTTKSLSNISTTTLAWAAFGVGRVTPRGESRTAASGDAAYNNSVQRAESWLAKQAGSLDPSALSCSIAARYGKDRTFSVPILTTCALARKVPWDMVKPLPFELAACPPHWWKWLQLPVVSYALPALIAVGQARHHHLPTRNPVTRVLRDSTRESTLRLLKKIQPASGGFLEAVPLTSFVTMSLASIGLQDHPVARRGVEFLARTVRPDGSWPIDSNLATWVTILSVEAMERNEDERWKMEDCDRIVEWLLTQQHRELHPYTNAAPGGWAWTDLSGGVPDADDTAGALIALRALTAPAETPNTKLSAKQRGETSSAEDGQTPKKLQASNSSAPTPHPSIIPSVELGVRWLLDLQNSDGGIPTFCKGWGTLPFDRSGPDLTAHAIRAWLAWHDEMPPPIQVRIQTAIENALRYLGRTQREDGAWPALWFGNQYAANEENLTYGTARVLVALRELEGGRLKMEDGNGTQQSSILDIRSSGEKWLFSAQNPDGGWGGDKGVPSSIEETALAVGALVFVAARAEGGLPRSSPAATEQGVRWLIERTDGGRVFEPSPIGFYFAKLWYYEKLYPLIFTVGALQKFLTANRRELVCNRGLMIQERRRRALPAASFGGTI